jgi:hypothetical protein
MSRRIAGYVEVEDTASSVVDDEPNVEKRHAHGRDHEEVHPSDHVPVIAEEGHPPLMRIPVGVDLRQVPGDRREAEADSELRQLCLNFRARHPFSVAIREIKAFVSLGIGGRPGPGLEIHRQ